MNKFLTLCLLAALGYAGWLHLHRSTPQADTPHTEQPPSAATTPVAAVQPPVPSAAVAPARRLAPVGTVFLLAYRSVRTPHGFTGFPPGTSVAVAADKGATLLVRGEGAQFEVPKSEVTNDLDVASRIAGNDAAEQQTLFAQGQAAGNTADAAKLEHLQKEASEQDVTPSTSLATGHAHGNIIHGAHVMGWGTSQETAKLDAEHSIAKIKYGFVQNHKDDLRAAISKPSVM